MTHLRIKLATYSITELSRQSEDGVLKALIKKERKHMNNCKTDLFSLLSE